MPTLIGIPAGKMIRTSSSEAADNLGLVRLTENYAFATSEIATFRARLKNMSIHKDVMAFVYPTPTILYPLVTIESSDITEDFGGISRASVNYTGILVTASSANLYNTPLNTSWLPPAIQRLQPLASYPNSSSYCGLYILLSVAKPRADFDSKFWFWCGITNSY